MLFGSLVGLLSLVGPLWAHGVHHPSPGSSAGGGDHQAKFAAPEDIKDQEHLKSHLADEINVEEDFSEEKLKFYYFKMFDATNDGLIDGLEIYHALIHQDEEHENATTPAPGQTPPPPPPKLTELELESETDRILIEADKNVDGFISWGEFNDYVDKQLAAEAAAKPPQTPGRT